MPDIAMCNGQGCEQKDKCYRFTATPNPYRQSYFVMPPIKADKTCEYFWNENS